MRYEAAITRLFALQARGMRVGIERMQDALQFRGITGAPLPMLHVAGTNGKGSVAAMLAASLSAAGYRTGLFTSPHLHRFTERFRIDGRPLAAREVARRTTELLAALEQPQAPELTFFECSTLLAVEAFRDHRCELAVMEVGLGGRLDSTNALPMVLSVITRIASDHTAILGKTLPQIAKEKAGIIRHGVPVIVGVRSPGAQRVIVAQAKRMAAPLQLIERDFRALCRPHDERVGFVAKGLRVAPLRLSLCGQHQVDNAAVAVAALATLREQGFRISAAAIRRGLTTVQWPARLEHLPGRPSVLLDAAHNPDGCQALATHLASLERRPRVLVFGAMLDKDYPRMLELLAPHVEHIVYVQARIPRAVATDELAKVAPGVAARSPGDALRRAKCAAGSGGVVVVAGSIFAVAELRARLLGLPSDPLIRL